MTRFEEEQTFSRWVYALAIASLGGALAAIAIEGVMEPATGIHSPKFWAIVVLMCPLPILILNLFCMVTRVTDREVYVRFGRFFPMFWKRIPLSDIAEVRSVTYRPLRDSGGWGIRGGRFEGGWCRYWTVRGNRGVFLRAGGKRYIIGSQQENSLREAIEKALSGS